MNLFDHLSLINQASDCVEFSTGQDDLIVRIEAHGQGVFRFSCGHRNDVLPTQPRLQARRAITHVEDEHHYAELAVVSLEQGWAMIQGDHAMLLRAHPFAFSLCAVTDMPDDETAYPAYFSDLFVEAFDAARDSAAELADGTSRYRLQSCSALEAPLRFEEDVWTLTLGLTASEPVYGLGMTQQGLDRRGSEIVSDEVGSQYSPLAWSPWGWGLYVDGFGQTIHRIGVAGAEQQYEIIAANSALDMYFILGEPLTIFNQYTALTGRAGQPPVEAMGVGLRQLPGQEVQAFVTMAEQLREHEVAINTLNFAWPSLLPIQEDRLNVAWDEARLPENPRAFFEDLQEQSWHAVLPTFPGIIVGTRLFDELEDRGWLLMDEEGQAYQFAGVEQTAGQPFALLDLTYKDAYQLWAERHQALLEHGQSLKTSSLAFALSDEVSGRHGDQGAELRHLYPALMLQSIYEAIAQTTTPPVALLSHDQMTLAEQRVPCLSLPCSENSWEGLQALYRDLMSAQHSAVPFISHVIGQVDGEPMEAELYLRYLALSVCSGNFAFHAQLDQLPVAYDEQTLAIAKQWLGWRYRLIPYVLGIIEEGVRGGQPVQSSMALAFPKDATAVLYDEQFMFGPAVLVAPILRPGGVTTVYLPAGEAWWDLNTHERYEGGQVLEYQCGLDCIPAFGREGHMLALGPRIAHLGEMNSARLLEEILLFGMPVHNPLVMRNKIRVMQMQGSSYIKGLEGLQIIPSGPLEIKRRGAEVRISPER